MKDAINSFFEAWMERVRSPILGSIIFVYLLMNWQPLFYLVFGSEANVLERLAYYNTQPMSWDWLQNVVPEKLARLIWTILPVPFGVALALGAPYINELAHSVISEPIGKMRSRDDENAHERLKKKNEWEEERLRAKSLYARELISGAQIDQEIDEKVQDPEKREEIRTKIIESDIATEINGQKLSKVNGDILQTLHEFRDQDLSKGAEVWLTRIKNSPYGSITEVFDPEHEEIYYLVGEEAIYQTARSQDFGVLQSAIEELTAFGLLKREKNTISVTRMGEEIVKVIEEGIPY